MRGPFAGGFAAAAGVVAFFVLLAVVTELAWPSARREG